MYWKSYRRLSKFDAKISEDHKPFEFNNDYPTDFGFRTKNHMKIRNIEFYKAV